MKVVIPVAGPIAPGYGFPRNPKPICLYHYKGEVILERQVKTLNSVGLHDIRVVIGYRKELIEQFVKEKNLGVTLMENLDAAKDDWITGGWSTFLVTLRKGLDGIDDDVIIPMGDIYLTHEGLRSLLNSKAECAMLRDKHAYNVFRVNRQLVPELRQLTGPGHNARLKAFCEERGGETIWTNDHDVDVYRQTDEGMMWATNYLGIDWTHWCGLKTKEKMKLLYEKGAKFEKYRGEVLIKIEGYCGDGKNFDVYGVEFEVP